MRIKTKKPVNTVKQHNYIRTRSLRSRLAKKTLRGKKMRVKTKQKGKSREKIEILETRPYANKILLLGRKWVGSSEVFMIGYRYANAKGDAESDRNHNYWLKFLAGGLTNREEYGLGYDAFYHEYNGKNYELAKRFFDNPTDEEMIKRFGTLKY